MFFYSCNSFSDTTFAGTNQLSNPITRNCATACVMLMWFVDILYFLQLVLGLFLFVGRLEEVDNLMVMALWPR